MVEKRDKKAEWGSLSRGDRELTLGGTGREKGSGEGDKLKQYIVIHTRKCQNETPYFVH